MLYRKSQIGWTLVVVFILVIILTCLIYIYQWGSKPITTVPFLISIALFVLIVSLFYKLTVEIDSANLKVIYGIGVIKFKIKIDKLIKTEIIKIPWYYGFGIRITPKGVLYNIHGFNAVLIDFVVNGQSKSIIIGTAEPKKLLKTLEETFK